MARVIGTLPQEPRRTLLGSLAATVHPEARQKAEMREGFGIRRLVGLLEQLPDNVTVLIQPKLGWMLQADCIVIGPGRMLVVSAVHWRGRIVMSMAEEWLGGSGVDLGRPDRRAAHFATRVEYSGHAAGLAVEPVVVFTDGPVSYKGPTPLATLVYWEEALSVLSGAFPADVPAPDVANLVALLGGK